MERLTIKNNDGSYSQPTKTTFEKLFYKVAEFEDFLEEHDCETLDEYTKQVRKEVCDKIRKEFFRNCIGAGETEEEQIYYITRTGLKKLLGEINVFRKS